MAIILLIVLAILPVAFFITTTIINSDRDWDIESFFDDFFEDDYIEEYDDFELEDDYLKTIEGTYRYNDGKGEYKEFNAEMTGKLNLYKELGYARSDKDLLGIEKLATINSDASIHLYGSIPIKERQDIYYREINKRFEQIEEGLILELEKRNFKKAEPGFIIRDFILNCEVKIWEYSDQEENILGQFFIIMPLFMDHATIVFTENGSLPSLEVEKAATRILYIITIERTRHVKLRS